MASGILSHLQDWIASTIRTPIVSSSSPSASSSQLPSLSTPTLPPTQFPSEPIFDAEDDESFTFLEHMAAGALAGMAEHIFMYPVDTIKTRMQVYSSATTGLNSLSDMTHVKPTQVIRHPKNSMTYVLGQVLKEEGFRGLWRGVGAVAVSAGPAHAVYFSMYEAMKSKWMHNEDMQKRHVPDAVGHAMAGAVATITSELIMSPWDVVKQRMQIGAAPYTKNGLIPTVRYIYSNHGMKAFFAGLQTSLVMSVPFSAIQLTLYEAVKSAIVSFRSIELRATLTTQASGHAEHEYIHVRAPFSVWDHCIAGGLSGAAASALTNPLDVVKTRLQTQGEKGARRYKGMRHAITHIWMEERFAGFLRGIQPRMLFHAPAAAICWTTYELCKHIISIQPGR
eukprot:CAMPEP_0184695942 /NCGR_PEP_ID=MMETSP0313-20130426/3399_1 /TAXON_ID=2792 /ORGANISM="Porphyridium aerugineum, Strain SAG 1380-2" /LENGTH=393 /DNA_ID=CAMNT_0027154471 /DNA_START=99 /DNA_END=1280 /DNA_ORIENTATION=-